MHYYVLLIIHCVILPVLAIARFRGWYERVEVIPVMRRRDAEPVMADWLSFYVVVAFN